MKALNKKLHKWLQAAGIACCGAMALTACQEEIDMSARYTFTGEYVGSYLEKRDSLFSQYVELLNTVKQSAKTESPVFKRLNFYGNYTCFAPTNQAINNYLDSVYQRKDFSSKDFNVFMDSVKANSVAADSLAKVIVYNSIIDCGATTAYETANFSVDNGTFPLANMNNRYLRSSSKAVNGIVEYFIEETVQVIEKNIEVENGYIHVVNAVVAPTNETIYDIFGEIEGMSLFGSLLAKTGWQDSLVRYDDKSYDEYYMNLTSYDPPQAGTQPASNVYYPEHRKYGFTIFAEPDDVIKAAIGEVTSEDDLLVKLSDYLRGQYAGLGDQITYGTTAEDLKKPDNAINQFVAYHILPINLPSNQLVYHYSEKGFDLTAHEQGNTKVTVPVFEYYETMRMKNAPRRLIKIYESKQTNGDKYLNRSAKMDSATYEIEEILKSEGVKIGTAFEGEGTKAVAALNGNVYPVDRMLVYTSETANTVLNERLRFAEASFFPELINLGYRRIMGKFPGEKGLIYFPQEFKLANIQQKSGTNVFYSSGYGSGWDNFQGDEVVITGNYDVTLKLPPVPTADTYEIRWMIQGNVSRGMSQVYFGEEGGALTPVDIPMDLRMDQTTGLKPFNFGWEEASTDDQTFNENVTKNLRNNGWMKGPRYYKIPTRGGVAFDSPATVRKLLTQQYMEPNKTYYLRFKSALDNADAEFYFDFLELVPSSVYNNLSEPEDEW